VKKYLEEKNTEIRTAEKESIGKRKREKSPWSKTAKIRNRNKTSGAKFQQTKLHSDRQGNTRI
jgi:hypothetical protein